MSFFKKIGRTPAISNLSNFSIIIIILLALGYPLIYTISFTAKIVCISIGVVGAFYFIKEGPRHRIPVLSKDDISYLIPLAISFLAILTWLVFYWPMLQHFWVGYDEPVLLSINSIWFETYDKCCARPLAGLEIFLGNYLLPDTSYSLPITSAALRWILAASLFFLTIILLPEAKSFAIVTGILMVVTSTELLRFTPGLSIPFFTEEFDLLYEFSRY